jgi:hypothetical protein
MWLGDGLIQAQRIKHVEVPLANAGELILHFLLTPLAGYISESVQLLNFNIKGHYSSYLCLLNEISIVSIYDQVFSQYSRGVKVRYLGILAKDIQAGFPSAVQRFNLVNQGLIAG